MSEIIDTANYLVKQARQGDTLPLELALEALEKHCISKIESFTDKLKAINETQSYLMRYKNRG